MRLQFATTPILVPCTISGPDGTGDVNLAFDTGAAITVLSSRMVRQLGYDLVSSPESMLLTTASGIVRAPIITLMTLNSMGVLRTDFPVAVHSLPASANVDRLLGTDSLTDLIVDLNFKKKWIDIRS